MNKYTVFKIFYFKNIIFTVLTNILKNRIVTELVLLHTVRNSSHLKVAA